MDPNHSVNSTSSLASISQFSRILLATSAVLCSSRNKKAKTERKVTVKKVTGPAAGEMMHRSTLLHLSSSLQGLTEDHDDLEFLPSLLAQLLSQLKGPYGSVLQAQRIVREEITNFTKDLVSFSLSQRKYIADLTVDDFTMLLDLLNQDSFCLFKKVNN